MSSHSKTWHSILISCMRLFCSNVVIESDLINSIAEYCFVLFCCSLLKMKVFVRKLDGSTCVLYPENGTKTSAASFRQMVQARQNIPEDLLRITYGGRELNEGTLKDCGVQDDSTVQVALRLCGGHSEAGFAFASMEKGEERTFSKRAPNYRLLFPGLNLKGRCKNPKCSAYHEFVWCPLGFSSPKKRRLFGNRQGFNIYHEIQKATCPLCRKKLDAKSTVSCGFYKCRFQVVGNDSNGLEFRNECKVNLKNGYEKYCGVKKMKIWSKLFINVDPL